MEKLNILLLGSGGRESALAWKMSQSPLLNKLFIAPGNGGTSVYGENIALSPLDFPAIEKWVGENEIDMIVVGNEDPLVAGIYDYFEDKDILVVGPSKAGAALEGSKDFAKQFMVKNNIPTARYQSFTAETIEDGYKFLEQLQAPYVLKADGLAAGKGVLILPTIEEAKASLKEMLSGMFGASSATVVIEEFLSGIECSVFVLSDGNGGYRVLPVAKDYKRIGDGDTGLNTGGMGAVSPVPFVTPEFVEKVESRIIKPTIRGLKEENIDYKGFIFIGLMNVDGDPYVIEYNVRMGDPETEGVMTRIDSDLLALLDACAKGKLNEVDYQTSKNTVTVMLVSGGYPEDYKKGMLMTGFEELDADCIIAHAGTKLNDKGEVVTSGGRVIAVTAHGKNIEEAREKAYRNVERIKFEGVNYRRDIGIDLMNL